MDNLHWHIYYEVLFIRKAGKYTVFNSGNAHDGNIPQIYIHRPYTPHKIIIDSSERYERYILYVYRSTLRNFSEDLLDLSIFEKACMLSITPTEEEAEWYTAQCESVIRADRSGDRTEVALLTALIFYRLLKLVPTDQCHVFTTRFDYIQDILQYIDENLADPMTIDKLCSHFGVGHTKLLSDFKESTGVTYKSFLTNLRMTRAKELLASGSSIINASLETGYSSEAHFIAAFKAFWGVTPGNFINGISDYSV